MEFMLDTVNIEDIKKYGAIIPLSGVTSNPSIIKKEGKMDFFHHMREIREVIGQECTLHIQVVAQDFDGMMEDAKTILSEVDQNVFIKVPVNKEGLKVIKALKRQDINVTATAIYTKFQAYLAVSAGADYVAPYFNRMENLNIDPMEAIKEVANEIKRTCSETKILAASFKNVGQVNAALECGAQAATVDVDIIEQSLSLPSVQKAVDDFTTDWEFLFSKNATISSLANLHFV